MQKIEQKIISFLKTFNKKGQKIKRGKTKKH